MSYSIFFQTCLSSLNHFLSSQTLEVNKKLNCCTTIILDSFDQLKTVTANKEGLLYGVPVSIKDNFGYKVYLYFTWQQEGKNTGRMSKNASK